MATRADITPELCRQLLHYEPETGKLFWKTRPIYPLKGGNVRLAMQTWNKAHAGREAFTARERKGYLRGNILNVGFKAHRVIWAMQRNYWPKLLDHINGNPADNRMCNLREATHSQNARNQRMRSDNTTGYTGVFRHTNNWSAQIDIGGKTVHLGMFETPEEAARARAEANRLHGYSERHGL